MHHPLQTKKSIIIIVETVQNTTQHRSSAEFPTTKEPH